ncbi:MAG: DUF4397 domain-containing protein [Clostridium sp.]|nr:DUF4397 domain-containing protein [Clostridium sp.]
MFFTDNDDLYRQMLPHITYIRILHSIIDAKNIDVYMNNVKIASNLSYGNFTEYIKINPGFYEFKIYKFGEKTNPILVQNAYLKYNSIYTIAATNYVKKAELLTILEPKGPTIKNKLFLKFVNLSPNSRMLSINVLNGSTLFKNISFKTITEYIALTPSRYTFQVKDSATNKLILNVPNIILKSNRFYSIYTIGLVNSKPEIKALVPLDGNSYLK